MNYQGMLIHRKRLERGWSQEGLCNGICAVSYLSKIEQGKAAPSKEVLELLLKRLGLYVDDEINAEADRLAEEAYEFLLAGDFEAVRAMLPELKDDKYQATDAGLDFMLLTQLMEGEKPLAEETLESCMDARQLAMQRTYQGRMEEAIRLFPSAFVYFYAGVDAYEQGQNYSIAVEYLQTAYDLAAKEGAPHLMLSAQLYVGNCYSEHLDLENMNAHYKIAKRLAKALKDEIALKSIEYNIAATQIETGDYVSAYDYFMTQEETNVMSLHKLAICCEKLGKVQEALEALDKAEQMECEYPDTKLARKMCALVRYRLEHPAYLAQEEYGSRLLDCFEECRKELPIGYASFHLPWVLEWYTANRQYKRAYELIADFPVTYSLKYI